MWLNYLSFVILAVIWARTDGVRHCTTEGDAAILSNLFLHCNPNMDTSHCPSEQWLSLFNTADIEHGHKQHYNFVNIGFNKGYNFATWMNVFAEYWGIDAAVWYSALKATQSSTVGIKENVICGSCNDCKALPFRSIHRNNGTNRTFRMVGVDLNKGNIHTVEMILAKLRASHSIPRDMLTVDFVFGAAGPPNERTPEVNTIKVPRCAPGDELCKIPTDRYDFPSDYKFVDVPLISIDKLAKELDLVSGRASVNRLHKLQSSQGAIATTQSSVPPTPVLHHAQDQRHSNSHNNGSTEDMVDILHIDTEGHDAEVLKTAKHLIQSHKVRALMFEYHSYLPWGNTALKEVLPTITAHHMECYFMGQNRLWPISHTCWHDRYETHQWSNVLCVLKSDVWFRAIQPLVMTVEGIRSKYPDGCIIKAFRQQEIFLIKDNKMHSFHSMDAFARSNGSHSKVVAVQPCHTYYLYPRGEDIK